MFDRASSVTTSSLRRALEYVGPVVAYAALIFFLSAQSQLPSPQVSHVDKVEHVVAYGIFAALVARAVFGFGGKGGRAVLLAILITSLYGATDELHQYFVPGRDSDLFDWVADTVGAIGGALAYVAMRRLVRLRVGKESP